MTGRLSPISSTAPTIAPVLAATRLSAAVKQAVTDPGLRGEVLGVHRSAVNVACPGWLLTLAATGAGALPNGVQVNRRRLDDLGLRAGMRLVGDGASLRVPEAGLRVELLAAATWDPRLPPLPTMSAHERARRVEDALRAAAADAPRLGVGPLLSTLAGEGPGPQDSPTPVMAQASRCLSGLLAALQVTDRSAAASAAAEAAMGLIGLGPGATPSGDDLLVGLTAGRAAVADPLAGAIARQVALRAPGRTTDLAVMFLRHAARLEFAERVHRAALGVVAPSAVARRSAVREAMAWGASSGADLLVGLLAGLHPSPILLARRLRDRVGVGVAA